MRQAALGKTTTVRSFQTNLPSTLHTLHVDRLIHPNTLRWYNAITWPYMAMVSLYLEPEWNPHTLENGTRREQNRGTYGYSFLGGPYTGRLMTKQPHFHAQTPHPSNPQVLLELPFWEPFRTRTLLAGHRARAAVPPRSRTEFVPCLDGESPRSASSSVGSGAPGEDE